MRKRLLFLPLMMMSQLSIFAQMTNLNPVAARLIENI